MPRLLLLWPLLWWLLIRLDSAVVVTAVVALGVPGCVALEVALVVPRNVGAHLLLPLPEGMPTVVENAHGWV